MKLLVLFITLCISFLFIVNALPSRLNDIRNAETNIPAPVSPPINAPEPNAKPTTPKPTTPATDSKPAVDLPKNDKQLTHDDGEDHSDDDITHYEIQTNKGTIHIDCKTVQDFHKYENGVEISLREVVCEITNPDQEKKDEKDKNATEPATTITPDPAKEPKHIVFAVNEQGEPAERNWLDKTIDNVTGAWHKTKEGTIDLWGTTKQRFQEIGEKFKHDHRNGGDVQPKPPVPKEPQVPPVVAQEPATEPTSSVL